MEKNTLCLMLVVVTLIATAAQGQSVRRTVLHGRHVLPETAGLPSLGRVPPGQSLDLTIGLPLRNQAALDAFLQELYDPVSPQYRHFLTPQQFTERFGPTEADYQALVAYAQASGFTITDTDPGRILVSFHAPAAAVEKAFHLKLQRYRHPHEARDFFAPDAEPTLDFQVPVQDIGGLDDYVVPQPFSRVIEPQPSTAKSETPIPLSGSGPSGTLVGKDFRKAYAPNVTMTGAGQYVGMVQFGGYYSSDIVQWENAYESGNHVPIVNVLLNSVSNITNGASTEEALDIQMQIAMAPGISGIYFYRGTSIDTILTRIASDNVVRQVSASWGYNGTSNTDSLWQQLAALGITFFNASGDSDAYPIGTSIFRSCSSSYVTSVGGTTLTMSGTGLAYSSEKVWNWSTATSGSGIGSGGGFSTTYTIPSWQTGIDMTANLGSTTKRNLPDVAMTGDNVYVWFAGSGHAVGGTSCAAPLWAGFMALVNQQAAQYGQSPIGALNPAVYAIGKGSGYAAAFHDTVSGNNFSTNSPSNFPAVAGYDLCTGWGTPKGQATIDALTPFNSIRWTGANGAAWDTNTLNWVVFGSSVTTNYLDGTPGTAVLFDDTLTANPNLTLNLSVTPGGVTFANGNTNYSLTGSGSIGGTGSLTKSGTGRLTITTTNTYSGGTTISAGTLEANNNSALGSGLVILGGGCLSNSVSGTLANTINLSAATTMGVKATAALTLSNVVSGGGALNKLGAGELILSGANTCTGATTVTNGTLTLAGNRTAASGNIRVGLDTTLATLNISAGSFSLGNNGLDAGGGPVGGITNGIINQTGGDLSFNAVLAVLVGGGGPVNPQSNCGIYNMSGGSISCATSTTRGLILGVNSYSKGFFHLSGAGNLNLPNSALELGRADGSTAVTNASGTFYQTGGQATVGTLALGGSSTTFLSNNATMTLMGGTFINSSFTKLCAGSGDTAILTIGGTADVTLAAFPTTRGPNWTANLTLDGGTLRPYAASAAYLMNLTHAYLTTNGANLNVAGGKDITIGQALEDAPGQAGTLTKAGVGVLTLAGANSYSGNTTISGGTLTLQGGGSVANSAVITVASGATLNVTGVTGGYTVGAAQLLKGNGTVVGPATINGTLAPGNSVGTLTVSSNLTLLGTTVMEIGNNSGSLTNDLVTGMTTNFYGGTLIITNVGSSPLQLGDAFKLFAASSYSGAFTNIIYPAGYTFSNSLAVDGTITVVPAPPPNFPAGGIVQLPDGNFSLTATGTVGATFSLWASTNVALVPVTNLWMLLTNGTIGASPFTIIDATATNFPQRFYRFSTP